MSIKTVIAIRISDHTSGNSNFLDDHNKLLGFLTFNQSSFGVFLSLDTIPLILFLNTQFISASVVPGKFFVVKAERQIKYKKN